MTRRLPNTTVKSSGETRLLVNIPERVIVCRRRSLTRLHQSSPANRFRTDAHPWTLVFASRQNRRKILRWRAVNGPRQTISSSNRRYINEPYRSSSYPKSSSTRFTLSVGFLFYRRFTFGPHYSLSFFRLRLSAISSVPRPPPPNSLD